MNASPASCLTLSVLLLNGASFAEQAIAQTVPNGTSLNLSGFTHTLQVQTRNCCSFGGGEPNDYTTTGAPGVQAKPFPGVRPDGGGTIELQEGLPQYAATPAAVQISPSGNDFWSGYSGEGVIYPNFSADQDFFSGDAPPTAYQPVQTFNAKTGEKGADILLNLITLPDHDSLPEVPTSDQNGIALDWRSRAGISGALNSYPYAQTYGYWQETAKIPPGQSVWPAFFLGPQNTNSTPFEIDVMEAEGANPYQYYATLHAASIAGGEEETVVRAAGDLSTSYHRYGVMWLPKTITFYLDGVSVASYVTPPEMNTPAFFITDLSLGGFGYPNTTPIRAVTFSISSIDVWSAP